LGFHQQKTSGVIGKNAGNVTIYTEEQTGNRITYSSSLVEDQIALTIGELWGLVRLKDYDDCLSE
jgi:hypothetical protein